MRFCNFPVPVDPSRESLLSRASLGSKCLVHCLLSAKQSMGGKCNWMYCAYLEHETTVQLIAFNLSMFLCTCTIISSEYHKEHHPQSLLGQQ